MKTKLSLFFLLYSPSCLALLLGMLIYTWGSNSWIEELSVCRNQMNIQKKQISRVNERELSLAKIYKENDSKNFKLNLEKISFLEKERQRLRFLMKNQISPLPKSLVKRLDMISHPANSLHLEESSEESIKNVGEIRVRLLEPIYSDSSNLLKLLYSIEESSAHLIVTNLELKRTLISERWESFHIKKLEMIKRDYTCLK